MRRLVFLRILIILPFLFGTACQTTGTDQAARGEAFLSSSQLIIRSLKELSFEPCEFEKPVRFEFDEQATVFEEDGKRRLVKGFVLPKGRGSYSVSVTSYKIGTIGDPAIMYPEVRVLDKNLEVVRVLPPTSFAFRTSRNGDGLRADLFINDDSRKDESFVLITNRSMDEAELAVSQVNMTYSTAVTVPTGPGTFVTWMMPTGISMPPIRMKASPIGKMAVEFKAYRVKKVGE